MTEIFIVLTMINLLYLVYDFLPLTVEQWPIVHAAEE